MTLDTPFRLYPSTILNDETPKMSKWYSRIPNEIHLWVEFWMVFFTAIRNILLRMPLDARVLQNDAFWICSERWNSEWCSRILNDFLNDILILKGARILKEILYDILIFRMMLWENSSRRHFLQLIVKTLKFNAGILKVTPLCVRFSRVSVFWFYFCFTLMHLDCAVSVFMCLYLSSVFVLRVLFCVSFLCLCCVSMLCFINISTTLGYHIVPKKSSKCRRVDTGSRDYNKFYESFVVPERVHVVPGWHPLIVKVWMLMCKMFINNRKS